MLFHTSWGSLAILLLSTSLIVCFRLSLWLSVELFLWYLIVFRREEQGNVSLYYNILETSRSLTILYFGVCVLVFIDSSMNGQGFCFYWHPTFQCFSASVVECCLNKLRIILLFKLRALKLCRSQKCLVLITASFYLLILFIYL